MQAEIEQARNLLTRCARVAAFSGAGLSAESGLSTFRDPDDSHALWSRFDPTELASLAGFEANPEQVIDWYNWRRGKHAEVAPNAAHLALAAQPRMAQITQNVDHLLEQAGVAPEKIYHLHGSIMQDRCHNPTCGYREEVELDQPLPLRECPRCGAWLRPAVVWFGEALPRDTWMHAEDLCRRLNCLLVVGTSATVYPAAGLIDVARGHGASVIVVDPNPGVAGTHADICIAAPAGQVLPSLLDGLDPTSG